MLLLGAAPCHQHLPDAAPWRISLRAASSRWRFATALPISSPRRPASIFPMTLRHGAPTSIFPMTLCHGGASHKVLCHGAPTSNKPHPAEKSTPVWLAIWHIWAGFANSQLHCATFHSTYSYKCTSTLLPPCNRCSDIANLSAHLHRLPTPPPYLRRMRLSPGLGASIRWMMRMSPGRGAGIRWMMRLLPDLRCISCKSPRARILVLGTSGAHWPARWPQFELTERVAKS